MAKVAWHFQQHPECSVAILKLPLGASLQAHPSSSLSHLKTGFAQHDLSSALLPDFLKWLLAT